MRYEEVPCLLEKQRHLSSFQFTSMFTATPKDQQCAQKDARHLVGRGGEGEGVGYKKGGNNKKRKSSP